MLLKGSAQKVTIYVNQDTRTHAEPLWSAILNFLRSRHVAGASLFWADMGFGSHEQVHDPRSEYMAEHRPARIEFIETVARVDELLPTLYEMVTDGLISVQDVRIVKAVARDRGIPEPEAPRKVVTTRAKLIQIYLGEADKYNDEPLYEGIVKRLRMFEFAGATVCRAILGYGVKRHTHKSGRFHLSHDRPIMISIIEKPERVNELIQVVTGIMRDGLIVTSDVELQQIVHEASKEGEEVRNEQPSG